MADNVLAWIDREVRKADVVIVLLDEAYPWNLESSVLSKILESDSNGELKISKMESQLLQSEVFSGARQGLIIPVYIGPAGNIESCLPAILRCKTVYKLPKDFDGSSVNFQKLMSRISTHQPNMLFI